ncbi:hypothetical protein NP493_405g05011 [Ridgeia piscesae]|uniref:Neurotransmitter-gated ion-channel transmembrane domain-containing protein n=1 Tax=Ridgeia piscesae TaxID=27915 RepID=A0AAD9L1D1_RIDPI|nr:hypothetical protein NP493_405g05011 [Ridgeia piscesae]
MSLFSSFFVLLLILVQSSPPTSASISLLGMYYCINMILIAISTMVSAVVINMTHYLQRRRVPNWLKMVCLNGCARLLCAKTELLFREECRDDDTHSLHSNGSKKSRQLHTGSPDTYYQRNLQWRAIAQVIDRVFFMCYAVGIVLSFIFVFPR